MYNKFMYVDQLKNMKRAKVKSGSQTSILRRHFQNEIRKQAYTVPVLSHLFDKNNELESLKCRAGCISVQLSETYEFVIF
jgi:hypothetical protein